MKRGKVQLQMILKTTLNFSASIKAYCEELEQVGRQNLRTRMQKLVTGPNLLEQPNIESLADFIHETRSAYDDSESHDGLLLCIYSGIQEDSRKLLGHLANLNKITAKLLGKPRSPSVIVCEKKGKRKETSKVRQLSNSIPHQVAASSFGNLCVSALLCALA